MHIFFVFKNTKNMTKIVFTLILIATIVIFLFLRIYLKISFYFDKNKKTLILKTYLRGFIKFLKITILFDKQIIQIEGIINKLQTFGELMAKKFKSTWLIRATKAIKSDIEYNFNIYDMITNGDIHLIINTPVGKDSLTDMLPSDFHALTWRANRCTEMRNSLTF